MFLADADTASLSAESQAVLLHNAAICACDAILQAVGLRVTSGEGAHILRLETARDQVDANAEELFERLDASRERRNEASYRAGFVPQASLADAREATTEAHRAGTSVPQWLSRRPASALCCSGRPKCRARWMPSACQRLPFAQSKNGHAAVPRRLIPASQLHRTGGRSDRPQNGYHSRTLDMVRFIATLLPARRGPISRYRAPGWMSLRGLGSYEPSAFPRASRRSGSFCSQPPGFCHQGVEIQQVLAALEVPHRSATLQIVPEYCSKPGLTRHSW